MIPVVGSGDSEQQQQQKQKNAKRGVRINNKERKEGKKLKYRPGLVLHCTS